MHHASDASIKVEYIVIPNNNDMSLLTIAYVGTILSNVGHYPDIILSYDS